MVLSVFESNKVVITKMNVFVGKGYLVNRLFKVNVLDCGCDVDKIDSYVNV